MSLFAISPRVSVIAFLDEFSKVEKTLEQVTKQTRAADCEILLINRGIINGAVPISNRIRVVSPETSAGGGLLNEIVSECKGEFIMLLPSGDSLHHRLIEEYLSAFDADSHIDALYADVFVRYEDYAAVDLNNSWYRVRKPTFDPSQLYYNVLGAHCMWRKSMHKRFGEFNVLYNFYYFLEFWNRAYSQGAQFKKIETISGTRYLPYGTSKKLFNSLEQNEKGYNELKAIHQQYNSHWQRQSKKCAEDKAFVIVTASYKNAEWYKRNLDSLFNQKYTNYRIIYIDDASPDNTGKLVQDYIIACGMQDKVTLICNEVRAGCPLANIDKATHMCKPDEIIVIVDGDDWLTHDNVLNRLNEIYQNPDVWCTYGQFIWFPFEIEGFAFATSEETIATNGIRSAAWNLTHLRTYYAGLYHKIAKEDLLYEGRFYPMAGDLAIMYPIAEMAGRHAWFMSDVAYYYNAENGLNENKVNIDLQGKCGYHILCKEPYQPLERLF